MATTNKKTQTKKIKKPIKPKRPVAAAPVSQPVFPPALPQSIINGVPQTKISRPTIILAAIGSTIVTLLLMVLYVWLDFASEPDTAEVASSTTGQPDLLIVLLFIGIALAVVLLPGFIVAMIVLPMLRKKH